MDIKPVSKQSLYQIASLYSREAIEKLVSLMGSQNENVALGAAKTLLSKTLPDLKSEAFEGDVNLTLETQDDRSIEERLQEVLMEINKVRST